MLRNHFAMVIDRSGSMSGHRSAVVKKFNEQLAQIREGSKAVNQRSTLSLYTFSTKVDAPLFFASDVDSIIAWGQNQYQPNGMTALYDAIGQAISDLRALPDANDPDTSFVVTVITDGEENESTKFNLRQISSLMRDATATDRWTFVFICPPGSVRTIAQMGVPEGNIQPWDGSSRGFETSSQVYSQGLSTYFTGRASGQTATRSFFQTNVAHLSSSDLKRSLHDERSKFTKHDVSYATNVKDFSIDMTGKFTQGNVYYELMKREDLQDYKNLVIEDRNTGALYTGTSVRPVLGLPSYGTVRLGPGDHGDVAFSSRVLRLTASLLLEQLS